MATTLYYNNAVDTDFNTLGNWWQNVTFTTPAVSIPTTGDTAEMYGDVTVEPSIHMEYAVINWRNGGNMCDFTFLNAPINFYKLFDNTQISYNDFTGSVNNGVWQGSGAGHPTDFTGNDGVCINGTFNFGTNQNGTVTNAIFNNQSINQAFCTNATFNNISNNTSDGSATNVIMNGGTNDGFMTTVILNAGRNASGLMTTAYLTISKSGSVWSIISGFEGTSDGGSITNFRLLGVPDAFSGAILSY